MSQIEEAIEALINAQLSRMDFSDMVINEVRDMWDMDQLDRVDDIADTCGTLINCADALKEKGAESVRAYITHGVLSNDAEHKIIQSPSLDELVTSNSIEKGDDAPVLHTKVRQLSLDELLGEAVRRVYNIESVSSLFTNV